MYMYVCVFEPWKLFDIYIIFFFFLRSRPFAPKAVNPMNMSPPYQITILHSANYLSTKYSNQNAYQIKLKNLIGSAQE